MIRAATAADLPSIVDIYNATIPSRMVTADLEPATVEEKQAWFTSNPVWVAESDDNIDGWLSFTPFKERSAYNNSTEISIYVHEAARGNGVGKSLLQFAIDEAPRRNIDRLISVVFAHNEPSINMLRKNGFEEWGLLPGVTVLDGVRRDVVILGRAL